MKVSRYDYAAQLPDAQRVARQIHDVLVRGEHVLGPAVAEFEERFASYVGATHAVGLNSGTDALVLVLDALGIGRGDEVVTSANTFHATALAIARVGATPVLVDCGPDLQIDVARVAAALTPRTRAVIAVHLFGAACDVAALAALCREHGTHLVEDCAQAVGARVGGRRCGTFGIAGCFSFHPSKNLAAAGDAGAVVTDDAALADRLRVLRGLGQRTQNDHVALGYNTKLDEVQAVVLLAKLGHVDAWNADRARVALAYAERLPEEARAATPVTADGTHVYHLFPVYVPERDETLRKLVAAGIDAVVRYPRPVHRQPAFAYLGLPHDAFPHANRHADHTLCLPIRPGLTDAEIGYVVDAVREVTRPAARAPG
jgi:dTDP-4-amino-4,6-dideoxygalactose transaminase